MKLPGIKTQKPIGLYIGQRGNLCDESTAFDDV